MSEIEAAKRLLDLELPDNDSGATTVRGYLVELIKVAWDEKRPFGNSGWHYDLYAPMAKAGLVSATLDEDGYVDDFPDDEKRKAEALLFAAIDELGRTPEALS